MSYYKDLYKVVHNIDTNVIGEAANYTSVDGDEFEIQGIFDNNYESVDHASGTVISSQVCVFSCHLEDFPDGVVPQADDEIVIGENNYIVNDPQEDGQGGVRLILHEH